MCHLEGDSMHSMTTNDERFCDKYDKLISDYRHEKHDMRGIYRHPFKLGKELKHEEEGKCR